MNDSSRFRLPIFPLGMVLLPGTTVPLHIFEPRYRRLMRDIQDGDRRFGIVLTIPGVAERDLPGGRVGCVARLLEIDLLPDGRSHILVRGEERFALGAFVESDAPYHVAEVAPVADEECARLPMSIRADDVIANFRRIAAAARQLDATVGEPPPLPDDPAALSFAVAGMLDIDATAQQALLSDTNPLSRLERVDALLRRALPDLELRAAMQDAKWRSSELQ